MPKKPGKGGYTLPDRKKQKGDYHIKIDLEQLAALCAIQCTDEEIAAVFGTTKDTIEKRKKDPKFHEAYHNGKAKGRISLRRQLFKNADAGNLGAQVWLSKQYLGMRDVQALEHTGNDGGPIESINTIRVEYVNADQADDVSRDD